MTGGINASRYSSNKSVGSSKAIVVIEKGDGFLNMVLTNEKRDQFFHVLDGQEYECPEN